MASFLYCVLFLAVAAAPVAHPTPRAYLASFLAGKPKD